MSKTIRSLFDPGKDIYRSIEKVITYGAAEEDRIKAEITEYVVTDSIEAQFRKLLEQMQYAMESESGNEIGVWVSGFYGSGKSSFTKYLGLAFDNLVTIDGTPFIKHLQDRLKTPQTKALFNAVTQRFPAAVVMLDLASEMLAGATQAEISTVLYYKVLQWAGYSRNIKVAALERRVEKDGRYQEFCDKAEQALPGVTWKEMQNDPLVVDDLVPKIAHEMYPGLFSTPSAFSSSTEGFFQFENQRVQEMIDILQEKSGKKHIIFIVDEVGQYISSRDNLILNLDGLAKNIKSLGKGNVWLISTAQQTLTEDDPRATLNSDKLYKLKDRFPIQIDLESSDIKQICYERLLGKAPSGRNELGELFDANGQALRQNTKLKDAKYYDSDFNRDSFINLYPFLPAHFEILLHLLGALAKSTGGIGLRSAIKVIQDILVESRDGKPPVADQPIGWLATTVTLFDALDKDIRHAFPSVYQSVGKVKVRFPDSTLHQDIAKSVAVLQILNNLPVSADNVASLMHPVVTASSRKEAVRTAIEEMLHDVQVPLGEKDGNLCFLSERLRDIEQERGTIALRGIDVRRILNSALVEAFKPLPTVTLHGSMAATTGLKVQTDRLVNLVGDAYPIQTIVEMVVASEHEATKNRLLDESRSRAGQNTMALLARSNPELDEIANEIYRCQRIVELHRSELDKEVKDYCDSQLDRAEKLAGQLKSKLKQTLQSGSFIFRGQVTAVATLAQDLLDAGRKQMEEVAAQVFDRHHEAPDRVNTDLAEKLLRVANPQAITHASDPLGLVAMAGGKAGFKTDHLAMGSIRDYIDKNGTVEGKRILEHFSEAPFGWSQDTTRYIMAVMLMAGEVKLKVAGREVTTAGQQAIEALKTNNSFKTIGVALRDERPSMDTLGRAAERLTELVGEQVVPLEQEITKIATKNFPRFQQEYAPLAERLSSLGLGGGERVRGLNQEITDLLFADASDAPQRLGAECSVLYDNLIWAQTVKRTLGNGLEDTVKEIQAHRRGIADLPDKGLPGELRRDVDEDLSYLGEQLKQENFFQYTADFNTRLTQIKGRVKEAVSKLSELQKQRLAEGTEMLLRLEEWVELTQEEQQNLLAELDQLQVTVTEDLSGLKKLLARDYDINSTLDELKRSIQKTGLERQRQRQKSEQASNWKENRPKLVKSIAVPVTIASSQDLDELIRQLQELKSELGSYEELELTIRIQGEK